SALATKEPSVGRSPIDFLLIGQFDRGLDKFCRSNHHLFADLGQPGAVLPINCSEQLSALRVDKRRDTGRATRLRGKSLKPRHTCHRFAVHFGPSLDTRQPHAHPGKRSGPSRDRIAAYLAHHKPAISKHRPRCGKQPGRVLRNAGLRMDEVGGYAKPGISEYSSWLLPAASAVLRNAGLR